ncbi:unnamed protein product [Rotaria sordida]|uniref:Uncharacterized protein n=1 Tax=Rotaria sordida TaxID=392033 RepID=A0A819U7Z3_9BILA|nr:unnamed protein product [Rotaria sordida]
MCSASVYTNSDNQFIKTGGMVGADIGVGWVDNRGTVHFQDRHALNTSRPIIDNTTNDWIALQGECDDAVDALDKCRSNVANGWGVGGDQMVEYPPEAGYPVGGDFSNKYYMVEIHFDNRKIASNRRDSSGVRFYIGKELRQYDLSYLVLGTLSLPGAIVIPPEVDQFTIDAFCPAKATQNIPESGITVISSFTHTHLQGYLSK